MVREYLKQNVYDALLERLDFIFREFDNIYISFSGGKDSGLLLNLLLDFRDKHYPDRPIGVFHQERADESLQRYSGFLNKKYGYKGVCWITKHFKDVWCASPLYDWTHQDIWHANYLFNYDYNKLYDLYYKAGLKVSQMRVASPFNDYSKDSLNLYRVIDPEIWAKLVGRVQGANFASIYGRTKAMGYRNVTLPEGHTWKSYTIFLLDTLPARLRNNYVKKFNTSIQFWHETGGGLDEEAIRELEEHGYQIRRNGVSNYTRNKKSRIVFVGKIPDNTDDIRSTKDIPSWKRMCYCILKNDHTCRFMGFGMTRQQQKRIDLIREKYDGYTMPVVCYYAKSQDVYVIVDGFHRYRVMKEHPDIYEREKGLLPVSVIDKPLDQRMASTIRHNRARGSHDVDLMSNIVRELHELGRSDAWISKHLGMDRDEILRLKQITGLAALFKEVQFGKAWQPDEEDAEDIPEDND